MSNSIDVPVPAAHRLIDLRMINHMLLVFCWRPGKHEKIVSLAAGNLSGRASVDLVHGDVIHLDPGVVPPAPFLGIHATEPLIVLRQKMGPVGNLKRPLLGA